MNAQNCHLAEEGEETGRVERIMSTTTEQTSLLSSSTTSVSTSLSSSSSSKKQQQAYATNTKDLNNASVVPAPADGDCIAVTTCTPLNYSSNIVLMHHLKELTHLSKVNLTLSILSLIYMGVNICLICIDYVNYEYDQKHYGEPDLDETEPVSDLVYHLTEFWACFCFSIVECLALAYTPQRYGGLNPTYLRAVMTFNIVATTVPAFMVSFSLETFEILSHEIEYINELTMTFVDITLLVSLWNSRNNVSAFQPRTSYIGAWMTTAIALVVATIQLGVYNLLGYDKVTEDMVGEPLAHLLEFTFEIISALIAFCYCMDNKSIADKEINFILYSDGDGGMVGNDNNDDNNARSGQKQKQRQENGSSPAAYQNLSNYERV